MDLVYKNERVDLDHGALREHGNTPDELPRIPFPCQSPARIYIKPKVGLLTDRLVRFTQPTHGIALANLPGTRHTHGLR